MVKRYQDCTREWNKEIEALKKMTAPAPYKKEKGKVPARKS